jgi:16S rRNA processing protein RimM
MERAFLPGADGQPREVRIERARPHKGRFVVKIAGVDTIGAAEALRGFELRIPEAELGELPKGSFYYHQLTGLRVEAEDGVSLGQVEAVLETGADARVLVVRAPSREETLVPFAVDFVKSVDLADGRLVVKKPEYVVAD